MFVRVDCHLTIHRLRPNVGRRLLLPRFFWVRMRDSRERLSAGSEEGVVNVEA